MSLFSNLGKGVHEVAHFFENLFTKQSWQQVFNAAVQTLAGYTEQILEAAKNEPAAAQISSIGQQTLSKFATLTGLAAGYNAGTHTTFVAQVTGILNLIQGNLKQILTLIDVKNAGLVGTVTTIANLAITGLEGLLALIPQQQPPATGGQPAA